MFSFTSNDVLSVVIAASFAAGLNVYATVATLGLLAHVHAFQLPGSLHWLGQTTIGGDIFSQLLAGTRPAAREQLEYV